MYTQAEIETKIRAIDAKLEAGVEWVMVDQTSTRMNLEQLRKERIELQHQLQALRSRRPTMARVNLGGF